MANKYIHILLDLDRTLWDMDKNSHETMQELFNTHIANKPQVACSFNDFWQLYTPINDALWEQMRQGSVNKQQLRYERIKQTLAALNIDHLFTTNAINKLGLEYTNSAPLKTNLMPNALELLEYLRDKNYQLHIITNGFKEAQLTKIKQCNLGIYFKHIITSEGVGTAKPHKRFFDTTLNIINAKAEECMVVGDDYKVDCEGALNAGIDSVWYNYLSVEHGTINPHIKTITNLTQLQNMV
jgi:putative hydrolase of the HAD superfamily